MTWLWFKYRTYCIGIIGMTCAASYYDLLTKRVQRLRDPLTEMVSSVLAYWVRIQYITVCVCFCLFALALFIIHSSYKWVAMPTSSLKGMKMICPECISSFPYSLLIYSGLANAKAILKKCIALTKYQSKWHLMSRNIAQERFNQNISQKDCELEDNRSGLHVKRLVCVHS